MPAENGAPETLTIGEVARRAGLRASAIRFYERRGLLAPPQRTSGQRRYDPSVLRALEVIDVAKRAGFSLREIELLMFGFGRDVSPSERWRQLAETKLAELDALAERIDGMRELLRRGMRCGCLRLEDCEVLAGIAA